MSENVKIYISESTDPWFNLSFEYSMFEEEQLDMPILFLWRNADVVMIGKAQNPWKECDLKKMEANNVKLARRRTGGGAVFMDLGNICFSFIAPIKYFDKNETTSIILKSLKTIGIEAEASGRNDIVVNNGDGPRKISGSAYRQNAFKGLHHGTLLFDIDMDNLSSYLQPDPSKLAFKGIDSVRSRVMNLKEIVPNISFELICDAVSDQFLKYYSTEATPTFISETCEVKWNKFDSLYAEQQDWNWNYGASPKFVHHLENRFNWGGVDVHMNIEKGILKEIKIFTDSLDPYPFEWLEKNMADIKYRPEEIDLVISKSEFPKERNIEISEFCDWLKKSII